MSQQTSLYSPRSDKLTFAHKSLLKIILAKKDSTNWFVAGLERKSHIFIINLKQIIF